MASLPLKLNELWGFALKRAPAPYSALVQVQGKQVRRISVTPVDTNHCNLTHSGYKRETPYRLTVSLIQADSVVNPVCRQSFCQ